MADNAALQRQMLTKTVSMIEATGLFVGRASAAMEKIGRFDTEFGTISQQNRDLHQDVLKLRSDVHQAGLEIVSRLDVLERRMSL